MTSFCGSVNEAEFLGDPSGSRRFWPVDVEAISWDFEMDWGQLWAQVFKLWSANPAFNLTAEEEKIRAAVALEEHTLMSAEEEKLASYYQAHKHLENTFIPMNGTEILEMLGYHHQHPAVRSKVGNWLKNNLGRHRKVGSKQRCWLFPYSTSASNSRLWPETSHLTLVEPSASDTPDASDTIEDHDL